jgi:hypothetical protein
MIYFRDFLPSSTPLPPNDPIGMAQNQLNPGDSLMSATSAFSLIFQTDGNLVMYGILDTSLPANLTLTGAQYTNVMWSSGTNGKGAVACNMQTDGNLVLYNNSGKAVWASNTQGNPGAFLRCQDDGNLVLYGPSGAALWSSNTYAGQRKGKTSLGSPVPPPPSYQITVGGGANNIFTVSGSLFTPKGKVVIFVNPVGGQVSPTQTSTTADSIGSFSGVQVSAVSVCHSAGGGQLQIWAIDSSTNKQSNTLLETCS